MGIEENRSAPPPIQSLLVKPAGADCNLACEYCFYREKASLYPDTRQHRMSEEVLESMIRQYLELSGPQAAFGWQGGEPLLMGLDFFRKAVELQKKYGKPGQRIANGMQTNGMLLDAEWARFLREYHFLVGLSLDGPADMHNTYRHTANGRPSHERVMNAVRQMRRYGVKFNALVVLNPVNVKQPERLYDYFLSNGIYYLQFIPLAEMDAEGHVAPFSITAEQYGDFLCAIFDRWLVDGRPTAYVRLFDEMLIRYVRGEFPSCTLRDACNSYVVIEHNGDVYACDFFVEPSWHLGNLLETPLAEIVRSEKFQGFAARKRNLPDLCEQCPWLTFCFGGCPKYRLIADGRINAVNYFCQAYRRFFEHSRETYERLALRFQPPAPESSASDMASGEQGPQPTVGRNDPCPCGSGKKYKHCCGRKR